MAFHFPLEAVLRIRRGQERMERLKLEAVASDQAQTRKQLDQITRDFFESRRRFQSAMGQEISGAELQFEAAREVQVAAARLALRKRLAELEEQRLKRMETYTKTRQKREVLENLLTRMLNLYGQELSRREQQELDDLFLMSQESLRNE